MGIVASFPLTQAQAAAAAATVEDDQTAGPFSLRGIITPFQRDEKSDFANGVGVELIRSNVRQVLGTKGGSDHAAGELRWMTDFGSQIHTLRHSNNSIVLSELARVFVVDALRRWEPRVRVTSTAVRRLSGGREAELSVRYNVVDLNAPATTILVPNLVETIDFQLAA